MKRLFISCGLALMLMLFAGNVLAISYCQDFLEVGNPGGPDAGLKSCDVVNPEPINPGATFAVDIWVRNVPEALLSSGFLMNYDPTQVGLVSVEAYDGADRAGPWDAEATFKAADASGPGSYLLTLLQLDCAAPDAVGDAIIARITFRCLAAGSTVISVQPVSAGDFETTIGCNSGTNYDPDMGTNTLTINQVETALEYCQDFLEAGNPGGPDAGLKTCDVVNPETINPGDTFAADIWASNIPEALLSSGFLMNYDPTQVSIINVEAYDGADRAGPWDAEATFKAADASGPGSYLVTLLQLDCAVPDAGGDVIIARITFRCLAAGSTVISVQPVSAGNFETTIGCNSGTNYDPDMGTGILYLTQETYRCAGNQECDDRIFCNGAETCNSVTGICLPGTPVDCGDGIDCTEDSCSESAGGCINIPINSLCDDGQYCNGTEVCNPINGCQEGMPVNCLDDGLFCNGTESCDEATDSCISSGNPCAPLETCHEETDHCWIGCVADDDCDGICNPGESYFPECAGSDNCPGTPNALQEDAYPPQGNGIGDACDCEGNFNCHEDVDVDGTDAFALKTHFGRSTIINPCTNESPCNGDFNCDHDCDGSDAARFKQDFGRSSIQNPCPACAFGVEWCRY